jgi:hypothetical protein
MIKNDECRADVEGNGTGLFQPLAWAIEGPFEASEVAF